jgi:aryl-alcohol dehydrogenase-like predicted oxidoreductase
MPALNPPVRPTLGLGLLSIGKPWGYRPHAVPSYADVEPLLRGALDLGIRTLDTAASYGDGEDKLGRFLGGLGREERATLTISTKCGEHWDSAVGAPFVDHSYDALARSIDRSLARLGHIDVLYVHRASVDVIRLPGVERAMEHARAAGIAVMGPSVSAPEAGRLALERPWVSALQFPFNEGHTAFADVLEAAHARNIGVAVNRPFGEGRLLYDETGRIKLGPERFGELLAFVAGRVGRATILLGTSSLEHLRENVAAYRQAVGSSS